MSRTKKMTVSALVAALCTIALLIGSVFPTMALSMAALAGLFPAVVVIACGYGWAAGVWVAVSLLGFLLLPNKGSVALFLCFFGHYPIWKALIEAWQTKMGKPILGWIMKLLGTALCLAILYAAFRALMFSEPDPILFSSDNPMIMLGLCVGLLAGFGVYDIAFSILIGYFRVNILPKLQK